MEKKMELTGSRTVTLLGQTNSTTLLYLIVGGGEDGGSNCKF